MDNTFKNPSVKSDLPNPDIDFLVRELNFVIDKLIRLALYTRRRRQKKYELDYCIQILMSLRNNFAEGGRDE